MIRELGHFTALSAIIVYLNAGIDSSPTDTLGNKGPDNLATSFAERLLEYFQRESRLRVQGWLEETD